MILNFYTHEDGVVLDYCDPCNEEETGIIKLLRSFPRDKVKYSFLFDAGFEKIIRIKYSKTGDFKRIDESIGKNPYEYIRLR